MRLLALSLLLASTTASAQDTVLTPGHPDLDVAALTLSDVTQDVRMMEPQPTSLGLNVETAQLDGDVLTIVSKADIPLEGGVRIDSTRLAWPSLALLSQTIVRGNNSGQATAGNGQIEGAFGREEAKAPFAFPRTEPVFPVAARPLVIRSLPLDQAGYEAEVTVFSPDSRFKDTYLTVGDTETVTLSGGREVEAVAVAQAGGPGGAQTHYVDPTTREILRTVVRAQGMVIHVTSVNEDELAALQAQDEAERAAAEAARAEATKNQITPGDASLIEIEPQSATYVVLLTQPAEQELGSLVITETVENGQLTLTSDIQIPAAGQNQQDETVVASSTLEPISRSQTTPQGSHQLAFADGRMTGTVTEGGETTEVDAEVGSAFGPGVSRFLIRSLPFAEGYATSFTQISSDGEVSPSFITVTGQESYTKPDGSETTVWVVVETEDDAPAYTYTIDTETRELYKMAFSPQPGVQIEMVIQ